MNEKRTLEAAQVMRLWAEGKRIAGKSHDKKYPTVYHLGKTEEPKWDWEHTDFWVVPDPPEPKYRRWTPEEAVGKVVRNKEARDGRCSMIIHASPDYVRISRDRVSWDYFESTYVQPDGTPVRELVEE